MTTQDNTSTAGHKTLDGGKQTDWSNTPNSGEQPLITIITSTFNAAADLPWTIKSIKKQKYPNLQWIVVDGASTDGTTTLLANNSDIIDYWISEPDKGIYDAWNKALKYANGEWIQFIGAGDELASPDVLSMVAPHLSKAFPTYDLVYGRLQFISETSREIIEEVGEPWTNLKGKWECFRPKLPIHPAVYHHYKIIKELGFDSNYKIAGDSKLLMLCIQRKDPLYIPILVDKMLTGGISANIENNYRVSNEIIAISAELGIKPPLIHTLTEKTKVFTKRLLLKFFPQKKVYLIADYYRKILGKPRKWNDL